jgi:hypothetical protein
MALNVLNFGALGNGINNDQQAIQLDTSYLVGGGQGSALVFAPSTKNILVTKPEKKCRG